MPKPTGPFFWSRLQVKVGRFLRQFDGEGSRGSVAAIIMMKMMAVLMMMVMVNRPSTAARLGQGRSRANSCARQFSRPQHKPARSWREGWRGGGRKGISL